MISKAYGSEPSNAKFAHNVHQASRDGRKPVDSFYTGRYNVRAKRLTRNMFYDVFRAIEAYRGVLEKTENDHQINVSLEVQALRVCHTSEKLTSW